MASTGGWSARQAMCPSGRTRTAPSAGRPNSSVQSPSSAAWRVSVLSGRSATGMPAAAAASTWRCQAGAAVGVSRVNSGPTRSSVEEVPGGPISRRCGARVPGRCPAGSPRGPAAGQRGAVGRGEEQFVVDPVAGTGGAGPGVVDREVDDLARDRAALGLVAVEQGVGGPSADHGGELPGEVVRIADPGVHPVPAGRRDHMGRVARQQHAGFPVGVRELGIHPPGHGVPDGHLQVRQAGGLPNQGGQLLMVRQLACLIVLIGIERVLVDPVPVVVHGQEAAAPRLGEEVRGAGPVGHHLAQRCLEADAEEVLQAPRALQRDARTGADRARGPVAADQPVRPHRLPVTGGPVLQHRVHTVAVLAEGEQSGAEPDGVGGQFAGPAEQHGLQGVLRADQPRRRRVLLAVRRPVGDAGTHEVRVDQVAAAVEEDLGGRNPAARMASSSPQRRKISIERAETPRAFGWWEVPGCASTSRCATPWRDSSSDRVSPTGPPPTISTGVGAGWRMALQGVGGSGVSERRNV